MEDDVQSLLDYGHIVARLADSLASDEANMVARLGWQISTMPEPWRPVEASFSTHCTT